MAQPGKNLVAKQETQVWSLGPEDPLEKGRATHSSILTGRIPWTEEPGGLQSTGLQTICHVWATTQLRHTHTPEILGWIKWNCLLFSSNIRNIEGWRDIVFTTVKLCSKKHRTQPSALLPPPWATAAGSHSSRACWPAEPARWEDPASSHCAGAGWQPHPRGACPKVTDVHRDLAVRAAAYSRGEKRERRRARRWLLREWQRCFPSSTPSPLRSAEGCSEHRLSFGAFILRQEEPVVFGPSCLAIPRLDSSEVGFYTLLSGFWLPVSDEPGQYYISWPGTESALVGSFHTRLLVRKSLPR